MRRFLDYLLLRTPVRRLAADPAIASRAAPGKVSGSRIALSLAGLILGIGASFCITRINSAADARSASDGAPERAEAASRSTDDTTASVPTAAPTPTAGEQLPANGLPKLRDLRLKDLLPIGVISLVICLLTYPGLYRTLGLYINEPTFLVLFVSFEYGFFWQAVIQGGSELLKTASP